DKVAKEQEDKKLLQFLKDLKVKSVEEAKDKIRTLEKKASKLDQIIEMNTYLESYYKNEFVLKQRELFTLSESRPSDLVVKKKIEFVSEVLKRGEENERYVIHKIVYMTEIKNEDLKFLSAGTRCARCYKRIIQADNAKYKNRSGTYDIDAYDDEYTVRVREVLEDPYLSSNNREGRALVATGYGATAGYGVAAAATATLASGPFAPIVGGFALLLTGVGAGTGVVTTTLFEDNKNLPEDVYFHITGDDSY
ncbi:hypothetical protein C1645_834762, partial [Glomus cerebriforme]